MTTVKMDNASPANDLQEKQVMANAPMQSLQEHSLASVQSDHPANVPPQPSPTVNPCQDIAVYEGYTFFQADPIPGQQATWNRVERTEMHLPQCDFYKMVQKRANKFSAAQQYQNLSDIRRAHINQLIHEQRRADPQVEWSCVYAKECTRPSKPRNAHAEDYETVSMKVVLMKRPIKTKPYPRTPMGDLVDLAQAHRQDKIEDQRNGFRRAEATGQQRAPDMALPRFQSLPSPGIQAQAPAPGRVVQGPLPRPVSVTTPFTRLDLGQGYTSEELERKMQGPHVNARRGSIHPDCLDDWASEASSSDDDDSTIFDQSPHEADSSDDPDTMDCDCQDPPTPRPRRLQSCSPHRRDPSVGSHCRRQSRGRIAEHKDRYYSRRYTEFDAVPPAKNIANAKWARRVTAGSLDSQAREKKYRIQRINDQEMRSRLLDCEARIEQWERALDHQARMIQNLEAVQQMESCRSYYELPSMRH